MVQDRLVPPLDKEASGIITGSEEILKAFPSKDSLNARVINDLIKDVLKNPVFDADEVDTDMLKRLQASIDSGEIQIVLHIDRTFRIPIRPVYSNCVFPDFLPAIIPEIIYEYHTRYLT